MQPAAEALKLDPSTIQPMFTELLSIDLPTALRVAAAENIDIRLAREELRASQGELEGTVGAAFPAMVPTAPFESVQGSVRATEGNLARVGFNTFQPSIAAQWILNPGRVIYDIIAAKKRLSATEHLELAVVQETLRATAVQYYGLVRAQARVSAVQQSVAEAEELLRISRLRVQTGTGVPADELRAQARLAERRQDLIIEVNTFYQASVRLAVTLHLDASVTFIPKADDLPPVTLVRDNLMIDELLELAVRFRPDLARVRALVAAAAAERGATWWGAFGPQFQVSYQFGGITAHAENVDKGRGIPGNLILNPFSANGSFSDVPLGNALIREGILRASQQADPDLDQTFKFSDQQRFTAGAGWRWSLSAFGDLKTADAARAQAVLAAEQQLDQVRAQVVNALQASRSGRALIPLAQQQVDSAQEALRLTQANLQAGTMTTLDVLQAQDAATQARLRYAEAIVQYNQAQVDLLAAIGGIDAVALEPPAP